MFSLLIKPASADCNLRCDYCFYLKKASLYPNPMTHRMSHGVLEKLIATYMQTPQTTYSFTWQGGEPTLMGVDFFKKVIALQQKYGKPGAIVSNGLQTNGMLINDDLASHLAEYKFLVGVSLDGPPELHDTYRVTTGGHGSHEKVLKGIECLRKHGVEFNILVLVNSVNVRQPAAVYDYLVDHGFYYHQYIPCVEWDERGNLCAFAITGNAWGKFLCGIFDQWIKNNDLRRVSVRHFDSVLEYMVHNTRNVCTIGTKCDSYFLVEHNGDVYPCDFFAEPDHKLGNILENNWQDLQASKAYRIFGDAKIRYHQACRACEYLELCMGDCPKHRYQHNRDPACLSFLCDGWKSFYRHTKAEFKRIADAIKKDDAIIAQQNALKAGNASAASGNQIEKVGRNAPCPCGSGKKYKKCCGQ